MAARIRNLRLRAGKSQAAMTDLLGLNPAWYADLEHDNDELVSTLSIFQAMHLANLLGVALPELMGEASAQRQAIPLMTLPDRIRAHVKRHKMTLEQFEERIGWEIRDFLASPVRVAADLPVQFLQAVSGALGINWLSLVPEDDGS